MLMMFGDVGEVARSIQHPRRSCTLGSDGVGVSVGVGDGVVVRIGVGVGVGTCVGVGVGVGVDVGVGVSVGVIR